MAEKLVNRVGAKMERLDKPLMLSDFNGAATARATHQIRVTFEIDGRQFARQKFIIILTANNVFIGQDWLTKQNMWMHPASHMICWPEDRPALAQYAPSILVEHSSPSLDMKAQTDVFRRDRLVTAEDRQLKARKILQNPWRSTSPAPLVAAMSPIESKASTGNSNLTAGIYTILTDPRQERWKKQRMPQVAVSLEQPSTHPSVSLNALTVDPKTWNKTFDRKHIPFPEGEDPEHIAKIRFIERCIADKPAPTLFVPKPHSGEHRFCVDYRWINDFIKGRQVLAPDVQGTISRCGRARRLTKIDIIRAFNRLLMDPGDLAEPLNRLLKKDVPFEKGPEQKEAFEALKKLATKAHVLAFFKPGRPTKVDTDASGKATSDNVAADALSRKTIKNPTVKARELQDRTFALIPPEKIEPIGPIQIQGINALTTTELRGADLVDVIIAENEKQNLGQKEGLLVVPETTMDGKIFLCTALIREAHEPKAFAHAGQNKTLQLLKKEYYWQGRNSNIKRYIKNCRDCQRNKTRYDKTPRLLHPLPIPKRVWEHVVVDGKSMPKDDKGYDYV
ncbi:Uu.00g006020.m01.CDS01 [Anthostomella pinea]|uniref:Uu.00g006020.m01.CDS01 n=1 Tax=Anthostomella pinea TaxID=933095 RepID=A0AAI8VKV7_9PEZI|nr:Uu.00g006020.m01.CDS01 [Anthostomella pinea]